MCRRLRRYDSDDAPSSEILEVVNAQLSTEDSGVVSAEASTTVCGQSVVVDLDGIAEATVLAEFSMLQCLHHADRRHKGIVQSAG